MNDEFRMEQRTVNQAGESLGRYTAKTFGWMFAGLLITLIVAISMYVTGAFIYVIRIPAWNFLLLAAELILVISLSARLEKMSVTAAKSMFFLYSAVNGIVFSLYFLMFDLLSLWICIWNYSYVFRGDGTDRVFWKYQFFRFASFYDRRPDLPVCFLAVSHVY